MKDVRQFDFLGDALVQSPPGRREEEVRDSAVTDTLLSV